MVTEGDILNKILIEFYRRNTESDQKRCLVWKEQDTGEYVYTFPLLEESNNLSVQNNFKLAYVYPKEFVGKSFSSFLSQDSEEIKSIEKIYSGDTENISFKEFSTVLQEIWKNKKFEITYVKKEDWEILPVDPEKAWIRLFLQREEIVTQESPFMSPLEESPRYIQIERRFFDEDQENYHTRKLLLVKYILGLCRTLQSYAIASLLAEVYRLTFAYSSENHNGKKESIVFYEFGSHRWNPCDEIMVRKRLINSFYDKIMKILRLILKLFPSEDGIKDFRENIAVVNKIRILLWDTRKFESIFALFSNIVYDANFTTNLDTNIELIAFEDGIYDLGNKEFRKGRQNDFISMYCGYPLGFSEKEKEKELFCFLETIFPEKTVLRYILRFLASCLKAGNKDKIFLVWTGPGDNGKSVFVNLVEKAFGKYATKAPTSLLTHKRSSSSSATPELILLEKKRITFIQEPDGRDELNAGVMKELTGNDNIYVRGLYKEGKNIPITTKIVLVANKVPSIPETDRATWSRIRVIPFVSTFVGESEFKEISKKQDNVFIRDIDITSKIDTMIHIFMNVLIKEYKEYEKYGLQEPSIISQQTRELRKQNDIVGEFIESQVVKEKGSYCHPEILYERYKAWLRNTHSRGIILNLKDFIKEIKRHDIYQDVRGILVGISEEPKILDPLPEKDQEK